MKTGPDGLKLIKRFEGRELEAYQDVVGVWTIGYGHTAAAGHPIPKRGMTITADEAEDLLFRKLPAYEEAVLRRLTVDVNQKMFDALVSITFNIGAGAMRRSTFMKRLDGGDYIGAAEAMQWFNKAGGKVWNGLVRRRAAEAALFLEGADELTTRAKSSVADGRVRESVPPLAPSPELVSAAKMAVKHSTAQKRWWRPRAWVRRIFRRTSDV